MKEEEGREAMEGCMESGWGAVEFSAIFRTGLAVPRKKVRRRSAGEAGRKQAKEDEVEGDLSGSPLKASQSGATATSCSKEFHTLITPRK